MHLISVTEYIPISIHALLAESDRAQAAHYRNGQISIHALLAESDTSPCVVMNVRRDFYPRSPCGERRKFGFTHTAQELFLSTLSLRRATDLFHVCTSLVVFLSTLSLRRATPNRGHSDHLCGFLSTLSLRRATKPDTLAGLHRKISIHALLAESDTGRKTPPLHGPNFYPRSPCGERLKMSDMFGSATIISIHALLAESDARNCWNCCIICPFLSTLSLRRATMLACNMSTC